MTEDPKKKCLKSSHLESFVLAISILLHSIGIHHIWIEERKIISTSTQSTSIIIAYQMSTGFPVSVPVLVWWNISFTWNRYGKIPFLNWTTKVGHWISSTAKSGEFITFLLLFICRRSAGYTLLFPTDTSFFIHYYYCCFHYSFSVSVHAPFNHSNTVTSLCCNSLVIFFFFSI